MEILLAVIPLFFLFIYFRSARKQDKVWQNFRQRHRERIQRPPSDEPIDPNFQFDQLPNDAERDEPRDRE